MAGTAARDYTRAAAIMAALLLAVTYFLINPTSFSPMGQAHTTSTSQHAPSPKVDLNDFDFPEGWGPTQPGQDQVVVPDGEALGLSV